MAEICSSGISGCLKFFILTFEEKENDCALCLFNPVKRHKKFNCKKVLLFKFSLLNL